MRWPTAHRSRSPTSSRAERLAGPGGSEPLNPSAIAADQREVPARRTSLTTLHRSTPLRPLLGFARARGRGPRRASPGQQLALGGARRPRLRRRARRLSRSVPARENSTWLPLVPALSALLAIALLRESQGGSTSGYSPLAILSVVWVAVMLDRRAVQIVTACAGLMFAVPLLLIGAPMYPESGWRGAALWTVTAYVVGAVVNATVSEQRRQAARRPPPRAGDRGDAARVRGDRAAWHATCRSAPTRASSSCSVVVASTDATLATVVEPRGDGFEITGSAGVPIAASELRSVQPAASIAAFKSARRVFVADVSETGWSVRRHRPRHRHRLGPLRADPPRRHARGRALDRVGDAAQRDRRPHTTRSCSSWPPRPEPRSSAPICSRGSTGRRAATR